MTLVNHVHEFLLQKIEVLIAGLVGASREGLLELSRGPARPFHLRRGALFFIVLKEALRGMVNVEGAKISGPSFELDKFFPSKFGQ